MSIEQLFFLGILLLVALVNFLRQAQARRQRRGPEPRAEAPPEEREPPPLALPPRVIIPPSRPPALEERPRARAPMPRPAPPPPRRARRLLGSHREVRRAIVLVSLLGPAPGLEPPARGQEGRPQGPR
jgi:hypothetical protein